MSPEPICLNCSSAESEIVFQPRDIFGSLHNYHKCSVCGLVYLWPQPAENEKPDIYGKDYYGKDGKEKFRNGLIVSVIDYFAQKRAKRFASFLPDRARIMDIGCGNGRFLEHLHRLKRNLELNGIEIMPGAALRASERLREKAWIHTVSDLEKFFGKNAFHAVSYIHVFEHLADPAGEMNQLQQVIRPDGIVMIVIPNIASQQAKKYKRRWFHLDPPRHLHFYPPHLLQAEMKKRGFQLIHIKYPDPEQNPFGELQSMLNLLFRKRDVLFERLKGNTDYAPEYKWFSILMMKLLFVLLMPLCILGDLIAAARKNTATVEMVFRKTEMHDD